MIYGAYIIGEDGLNWATLPFWRKEKQPNLSGPLISSLVSLSDVTFKGKVRRITTQNRAFLLKHANIKPGFIAAVIADKIDENQLALTFLQNMFSQTKQYLQQRKNQVGSGFVLPQFKKTLEKKIKQIHKNLMHPASSTVKKVGKDIYCSLSYLRSENVPSPFETIKANALKKKKTSYNEFLTHCRQTNYTSTKKDVLTHLSKNNFEKVLVHAHNLKENTSNPVNSLIWVLTSVYLNRFPPSYPAPPISTVLQEIHTLQNEVSQELKNFLKLAKLELLGKKSLEKVAKHRKFLEKNSRSFINTLLQQDPLLKTLLSLLLVGWYPKVIDSQLFTHIIDELSIHSQPLALYVRTLRNAHQLYTTKREPQEILSLLESLSKTILQLLKNTSKQASVKKKAKIANYTVLFTLNFYALSWQKLGYNKLKHYLKRVLQVGNILSSKNIFMPPFLLPSTGLTLLMIQEAFLLLSTLYEFNKVNPSNSLLHLHEKLVKQVLTSYYADRINPYHTHMLLSTSFKNLGESFLLLRTPKVIKHQLSYLQFLQTTSDLFNISQTPSFMQGILSSLAVGSTFLAPAIPISKIKTKFMKNYFHIPLQIAMYSDTTYHDSLLEYSIFKLLKHSNNKEGSTRLRLKNCEFLYKQVAETSNLSLFFQGLLLKALSEAGLEVEKS